MGNRIISWIVFCGVAFVLVTVARKAEHLMPASFDASQFTASVVEPRDNLYGVVTLGEKTIWMAGSNGKVVRSDDGGESWALQETDITDHLQDIAAWDENRAVAVGNDGAVVVTGNGGKKWKKVPSPRSKVANKLVAVESGPDGKGWAVGVMGALLGTEDYGASWERLIPEEDVGLNGIAFSDAQNGWVVGEFGRTKRTVDGGETWEEVDRLVQSSLMNVAFRDANNGIIVGLEGVIMTTSDGGDNWTLLSDKPTAQHLWDVTWHESADSWVCVGNQGVYVIGDKAAQSWKANRLSDTELLWHTSIAPFNSALYIVGGSQGVLDKGQWSYIF